MDDLGEDGEKQWYERLRDDEIGYCPVETFDLCFDVIGFAKTALDNYRNRTTNMGSQAAELSGRGKHILAAKCEDVGFFAGLLALEKEQKCL